MLLSEACKSNEFIRNTAEDALLSMSENVTPQRAMVALIQEGARFVIGLESFIFECKMIFKRKITGKNYGFGILVNCLGLLPWPLYVI